MGVEGGFVPFAGQFERIGRFFVTHCGFVLSGNLAGSLPWGNIRIWPRPGIIRG
jgi:hypothetical protein